MAWNPVKTFQEIKNDPWRAARAGATGGLSEYYHGAEKTLQAEGLAGKDPMSARIPQLDPNEFIKPVVVENPYEQAAKDMIGRDLGPDFTGAAGVGKSQLGFAGALEKLYGTGSAGLTDLIGTLQKQQAGDFGPGGSLARQVLEQGLSQNIAGVRSQLASQRGLSPALAARYASQQTAQLGGQTAQQAAMLGLQQQLEAQKLLGSLTGTAAGVGSKAGDIYGTARTQEIEQAKAKSDADLRRLNTLVTSDVGIRQLQAQTGMKEQEIRARVAEANQAAAAGDLERRNKILSGILSGGSTVGAAFASQGKYSGGRIDGTAPRKGDHPENDIVPANLSPGEIVIPRSSASSKKAAKSFIDSLDDWDDEPSYGKVLKARSQKKNYADGGVVEPDMDQDILDMSRKKYLEKGFDTPIPGVAPMKRSLDEMLTRGVVEPMAKAGYPNVGAAMATVPSTLAEALVPSTAADLAGTLIPFPKSFLTKDAKKVLKAQKTSNIPVVNYTGDWANNSYVQSMMERLSDDPKVLKKIENILKSKGEEPYVGDFTNAIWRTTPSLKEMGLPQPIPQQVENLKGVLGKEVPKGGVDPFAWMDTKYEATKKLLEKNTDTPLTINTRSDLVAHDDYMNLLNPSKHKINIHLLGDMDIDRLSRVMEPGAPSIKRRLDAAKKLSEAGFDVTLVKDVLQNKNMPKELQQMLFQSQPTDRFKVKQNVVNISDEAVENIKKLVGDNFK